jgi:hypothetical protein
VRRAWPRATATGPTYSIQDGKKRFGRFRIVFMGIQLVNGFYGELGFDGGLPLKRYKWVAFNKLVSKDRAAPQSQAGTAQMMETGTT